MRYVKPTLRTCSRIIAHTAMVVGLSMTAHAAEPATLTLACKGTDDDRDNIIDKPGAEMLASTTDVLVALNPGVRGGAPVLYFGHEAAPSPYLQGHTLEARQANEPPLARCLASRQIGLL